MLYLTVSPTIGTYRVFCFLMRIVKFEKVDFEASLGRTYKGRLKTPVEQESVPKLDIRLMTRRARILVCQSVKFYRLSLYLMYTESRSTCSLKDNSSYLQHISKNTMHHTFSKFL